MKRHVSQEEVDKSEWIINRLGITAVHWRLFFGNPPAFVNGQVKSIVSDRFGDLAPEILYIDGKRITPLQTFFEWGVADITMPEKKVYIFQSAFDALAFFQIRKMAESNDVIFVVGKYPSKNVLVYIKKSFPIAKFIICFPNNFFGSIADVRIAAILSDKSLSMEVVSNKLLCSYKSRDTAIPLDKVSLSKVSEFTGFSPKRIRTLKPKLGKESFFDLLGDK